MQLTEHRAWTLAHTAHALRPEWQPASTMSILQRHKDTIPATNYLHALQALVTYATATNPDGTPVKLTPAFYPTPGPWWDTTKPKTTPGTGTRPDPCEDHPEQPAHHCICCWGDVKAGMRQPHQVGKHLQDLTDGPQTHEQGKGGENHLTP